MIWDFIARFLITCCDNCGNVEFCRSLASFPFIGMSCNKQRRCCWGASFADSMYSWREFMFREYLLFKKDDTTDLGVHYLKDSVHSDENWVVVGVLNVKWYTQSASCDGHLHSCFHMSNHVAECLNRVNLTCWSTRWPFVESCSRLSNNSGIWHYGVGTPWLPFQLVISLSRSLTCNYRKPQLLADFSNFPSNFFSHGAAFSFS